MGVTCSNCYGTGTVDHTCPDTDVPRPLSCIHCGGSGTIRVRDEEADWDKELDNVL